MRGMPERHGWFAKHARRAALGWARVHICADRRPRKAGGTMGSQAAGCAHGAPDRTESAHLHCAGVLLRCLQLPGPLFCKLLCQPLGQEKMDRYKVVGAGRAGPQAQPGACHASALATKPPAGSHTPSSCLGHPPPSLPAGSPNVSCRAWALGTAPPAAEHRAVALKACMGGNDQPGLGCLNQVVHGFHVAAAAAGLAASSSPACLHCANRTNAMQQQRRHQPPSCLAVPWLR